MNNITKFHLAQMIPVGVHGLDLMWMVCLFRLYSKLQAMTKAEQKLLETSEADGDDFFELQERFLIGTLAIDPEGPYTSPEELWDGEV